MDNNKEDFASGFIDQPMAFIDIKSSIMHIQGPRRVAEHPAIIADKKINKHQENVKHNDTCLCKESNYDNLVVMFCHIEQYPQFRCYCNWCIGKLRAETDCNIKDKNFTQDDLNTAFRILLAEAIMDKGIDLKL